LLAADFGGASPRAAPARRATRPTAQGAGEGNTTSRHQRGGAVLRRREEHPHSLSGCGDPESQALPPPRAPLVFKGCAWRYRSPSVVHRCALGMAGAPCFKYADVRCTWHSKGAPGISRCTCNFHGCGPRVHPGNGRCALFQISGCQVHLGISRCTWESPGAPPGISKCT
jgi:hypothetical protein